MNLPAYQRCPSLPSDSSDTSVSEVLSAQGYCSTQQGPIAGVSAVETGVADQGNFWPVSTSLPETLQIPRSESIDEGFWGKPARCCRRITSSTLLGKIGRRSSGAPAWH